MKVRYEKKFNLGNFENEAIAFEIEVKDTDNPSDAFDKVRNLVYTMHQRNVLTSGYLEIINNPNEYSYSEVIAAKEKLEAFNKELATPEF